MDAITLPHQNVMVKNVLCLPPGGPVVKIALMDPAQMEIITI